jgi:outer-membrane receptor for ferric coprogen and ferric-rhodotorulic acid
MKPSFLGTTSRKGRFMTRSIQRPCAPRFRHTPLVLSILAACASLGTIPHYAHAQTVQTIRHYDIPAGPLDQTLNRFAAEAGILLTIDASLTAGKQSPGLKGETSPAAGLQKLLQGTGLEAVKGDNGWQLRRAPTPTSGEAMLAPMTVTADAERSGTTEGSGSYKARYTNTATKLNLSPRETPQTVTVVTRQQMDDFGMTTVDDALKTVSGVSVQNWGSNGNTYYSRNFALQTQYDGIPNPIGISTSNRSPVFDSAFLDRVEVLQGASGLTSGAGDPGGTINLVRKRPTHDFQAQAELQLGSWNTQRLVGDISGRLIESGAVRGRLVVLADNRDSFVDHAYNDKRGIYAAVDADLSDSTTLTASVQYQKDKGRNHFGVPLAADGSNLNFDRSTFFANANAETAKEYKLYTLGVEQKLPAEWVLKAAYTRNESNVDISRGSFLVGSLDAGTGSGLSLWQHRQLIRDIKSDALDAYVSGPLDLWGRRHELVFGLNGSEWRDASCNSGNVSTAINAYTFDSSALPDPAGACGALPNADKTTQIGGFATGRFSLTDSLKLILGARVSDYEYKSNAGTTTQKETGVVSPYAGLIYDINKQYSAYASYSDIFKPQSELGTNGNPIKPIVGSNYEVGIKGELLGGKLNVAAAVFRLIQGNLPKLDESAGPTACAGSYCYLAQDDVISKGIDLSANGEIRQGWNVAAGYSYVDSKYASGSNQGQRYMTYLPQHKLRLSTQYRIPDTDWSLGGSVQTQSKIYLEGSNYKAEQGNVTLVGLTAKYRLSRQAELTFLVDNLLDEKYFESMGGLNYNFYGAPRSFAANLKYRF